ncbi:MerR family transcriptional regulator [Streptococcus macacae]|uniref:Transcriptional regulator, MerR family n=1 Tax=Streptococcus macacae NCTC 11558 TaxID=764298 RepID=G5JX20_9STRE|nr:MerR family transcriptional regulator [Streptococcus macacae]EHJ53269.1 transcriptional regulator, MerR family [Streptococcus macacae NCTC 11558]SUN79499.1 transcriptional regulator [Streptococcus macacae NCTC 11558]
MHYSIGKFSTLTHLSIHTLRYYEKEGLLKPKRDSSNRRYYDERDYQWLLFILRLKAVGMPIKEIKHYSQLREAGEETYLERLKLLEEHLQVLDQNIAVLLHNREKLVEKINFYKEKLSL